MSNHFRYLGSINQKNGKIDCDINHKIQAIWNEMEKCNKSFM